MISVFGRLRQEDHDCVDSLGYRIRFCLKIPKPKPTNQRQQKLFLAQAPIKSRVGDMWPMGPVLEDVPGPANQCSLPVFLIPWGKWHSPVVGLPLGCGDILFPNGVDCHGLP